MFPGYRRYNGESNKNKDVSEAQKKYILISGALNSKKERV
jgi:hypothetical protein